MFDFLKTGPDATPLTDKAKIASSYKSKRLSVFLSITLGYALYYVKDDSLREEIRVKLGL